MKIIHSRSDLKSEIHGIKKSGESIGFVPTMGALHAGHVSLIKQSKSQTDFTICSIFVNPTQFTDLKDLERYPRPIESDIVKLNSAGCDLLFSPPVEEMYQEGEEWNIDLHPLDTLQEGAYRPGHFQGVTQIVYKFFSTIKPDKAFFGLKDYQQFLVIKKMVEIKKLKLEIIGCETIREEDGLAMSSRNVHLSQEERKAALLISESLFQLREEVYDVSLEVAKESALKKLKENHLLQTEYFEIVNAENLTPIHNINAAKSVIACTAVKVGSVRLIDNLLLK